jgi:hypothetical protein
MNMDISEEEECQRFELRSDDFPRLKIISDLPQKIRLKPQFYYRYIFPTRNRSRLSAFYGEDCSFCCGQMFDSCDILVEFVFTQHSGYPFKTL